jgi:hypothetical protein
LRPVNYGGFTDYFNAFATLLYLQHLAITLYLRYWKRERFHSRDCTISSELFLPANLPELFSVTNTTIMAVKTATSAVVILVMGSFFVLVNIPRRSKAIS